MVGRLVLTDFFGRESDARDIQLNLPPNGSARRAIAPLLPGRVGFFLAHWIFGGATQTVRCANIEPIPDGTDTFFGFNHAYPWAFLVRRAQAAGAGWWRDWSAKWHTVEPTSGRVDYAEADAQIGRVADLGGRVLVLLPFPSTPWSSAANERAIDEAAGTDAYLRARMRVAFAARNPADFDRYAARTAAHYAGPGGRADHVQLLNEPVYTTYALPRKFGYGLSDYLRLIESASRAIRAAAPGCRIVGGISCNADAPFAREFIEQGGLRHIDIVDLHNYDAPRPAATHDDAFREFEALVRARGGPKPIWITEWGCYADDDPPTRPWTAGDATMNRCRWLSERAAAEHIAAYAAVAAARGVRKIFFHAGTCGPINGADAGGVLFEYGGAPRRMLPAVAAFQRWVGVPDECVAIVDRNGFHARVFRVRGGGAAVAWRDRGPTVTLVAATGLHAFDVMGDPLSPGPAGRVAVGSSPVYFIAANVEPIVAAVSEAGAGTNAAGPSRERPP